VPRANSVTIRLSDDEKAVLEKAAARAGLGLRAYIGQAAVDAAELRAVPVAAFQRQMLAELIHAAGLVRRAGVNLNQAVAKFNATGQPGPDLGPAVAYCLRVARHVDEAALAITRSRP
jgi:hypothetical protein